MLEFTDKTAPYQTPFEVYGLELRFCTNSKELHERVEAEMLPPGWKRVPRSSTQKRVGLMEEPGDIYSIYNGELCTHDAPGLEYALLMLEHQFAVHLAVDATNFVSIHAGVVGHGDRAILIPGFSFSGKTTLTRALVEAGAQYYSDEYAMFDEDGLVHPYARRLSIRPPEGTHYDASAEELGGTVGTKPLRVGLVALTHYVPGAEWLPTELSPSAGALAVVEHAVSLQLRPAQTLETLRKALEHATILQGERGEANELAAELLDTLRAAA